MSHFTVLVVGDDVDAALAPYDENTEVAPYREYLDADDVVTMATHYGIDPADLSALAAKMDDWRGRPGGVDDKGLYCLSNYNPSSKWDWYTVGGRWRGYFTAKPGATGEEGDLDTFDTLAKAKGEPIREAKGFDVIRKGDVDVERMEREAVERARETWRMYAAAVEGTPVNETWATVRERYAAVTDETQEAYRTQPRIAALEAHTALRERVVRVADWDQFLVGEEAYVRRAWLNAFAPFALIDANGEWHEHGKMGWFGMAHDERDDWPETFRKLWDLIPDDATLTVVDCHV